MIFVIGIADRKAGQKRIPVKKHRSGQKKIGKGRGLPDFSGVPNPAPQKGKHASRKRHGRIKIVEKFYAADKSPGHPLGNETENSKAVYE